MNRFLKYMGPQSASSVGSGKYIHGSWMIMGRSFCVTINRNFCLAMECGPFSSMIYLLNMVVSHSYVKLPEG